MAVAAGSGAGGERVWGGQTLAERKETRRRALLAAALDLIGEQGGSAVTVRSVCRRAGLTDRYFYESFAGRDELMVGLYMVVADEMHALLTETAAKTKGDLAAEAHAMIDAIIGWILDDPRKGRLLLVEPLTDPTLGGASIATIPQFSRLVVAQLPKSASKTKRNLTAVGLTGALGGLFAAWAGGTLKVSREELTAHCVDLITGAY